MIPNQRPRPRVGQAVTLVIAGKSVPQVARAKVLFDRGRGLIVEAVHPVGVTWVRQAIIIMSYESSGELCTFSVTLAEVISATRGYLQPRSNPSPMDRREFLRMDVTVGAAIAPPAATPPPLMPTLLDLSPSGFRWFSPSSAAVGDPVRLYLQLPDGFEKLGKHEPSPNRQDNFMTLDASVVCIDEGGTRPGTAAVFTSATTSDREAILDVLLIAGILKKETT